ncbi:uncharacterized protein LOC134279152 [Saccostrea cucullata]|uniref:uncharacterized protein LOC134279152 n=1 Tax=Saccostrea cuccullata TaxID=36930 RepID=UPI002ED1A875
MTSISWKRNGCDLILSDESENYSGGTLDDFCLRISHVKDNCFGTYECTARNVFGEMTIHITLECPSFTLGEIKTDGEDVIIEYTVSVSEDCKPMTSISWKRNGCDLILSDESENYSGGTPDDFFLRISHIKNDCFGTYECTVRNVFGEMTIHFTLECPSITLGEIKADGEDVEVEYAVSVSEDCKPMTSISWKRNGCDLILSDESENYSGGTLDDFCLRINHIKNDCFGTYECTVRNVFGEMTIHFTLDDIQCRSRECQSFLLCCLLLDKCQPSKNKPDDWEEKLKISWKFCCGDDDKNITKRVLTVISDGKFEDHINCENNEYKLLSPDVVFQSFLRKSGFVDFFLQHACSRNISIYCRSAGYKKDPCETCCNVTPEQFKVVVQRLNFDILTNNSIKDKACHPIIEEALNIPKGILSLGSEGISKYLEELTHGDHVVFVARGMLVGCEGAGKTSLLRRLRGDDNPNPTSTRGIDVNVNVFTVDGGKLEVTTNPNKACLRSTLNQNDRTDVQNQTTNASANQLSGSFDFKDEKIEDEKISTKKPQTSYEINSKRVTTTIHQRYQRENKENGDSSVNDNTNYSEEDEIVTENILSLDFSIPTSDDTDIPHKISMEEILSESFADRGKIVTIFDFAGQFAYYACHHLYFSPNDFYILVMDITKRLNDRVTLDKTTQIHNQGDPHDNISDGRCKIERSIYDSWTYLEYTEYWLQSILTNSVGITPAAMKNDNKPSEQAPLILIATHAEEKTKKDVEDYFRDLRDKFPTMSVHIDYTNAFCTGYWGQNSNLDEIKNGIIKVVKTLPNWGKRIPLSWFYIETLLRKISSWKIIKTDQLLQRCGTSGVKVERKDDLITPLLFLHNTGVVLFFDEENLRDFIILDVQWFVDAFKNIITDENHAKRDIPQDLYEKWKMFNNNGLLTGSLLSSIWNKCEQNDLYNAKKTEIIAMMIKLNVLTEVTPSIGTTMSDMWYCPCMNKQTFPTAEFEKLRNSSLFCFKFNFLPKDLFHRLIAACSNKLKWKIVKLKFLCVYQTATVFDIKKSKVLIGMHSNDKILIQYLDLPESKSADYLGIREKIRKLIDELTEKLVHCAYEVGYMCEKNVFGKSNISLSHFIAGSDLEDTEEDGISCSECGFSRKISVTDIKWEGVKHGYSMKTTQKSSKAGPSPPVRQLLDEPETVTTIDTGYKYLCNVVCLSDKEIWTRGNDYTMKLYSINQGLLLKSIITKSGNIPWDIAVTRSGDLVYTDTSDRTLNIVKNERMEVIRLQNWCPYNVCSTSSGDLLVIMKRDDKLTKVVRYSGSKEKQSIQFDDKGKPLYSPGDYSRYITENRNLDICVSDCRANAVVVVNQAGELRFRYNGYTPPRKNRPFYARGITTDSQSHILTADNNNDCVHIIDQDGQFLCYIDGGLSQPWGLCTDTNDNLFVAQFGNNQVKKIKYLK